MIDDSLTIVLDGEVPLGEFARTIESFFELVKALSEEVGQPDLDWVLEDLQVSSAVATVRAPRDPQAAGKVASAYAQVGESLERHTPMTFSTKVRKAARNVVSIRDKRVRAVRFETAAREATVRPSPSVSEEVSEDQQPQIQVPVAAATGAGAPS